MTTFGCTHSTQLYSAAGASGQQEGHFYISTCVRSLLETALLIVDQARAPCEVTQHVQHVRQASLMALITYSSHFCSELVTHLTRPVILPSCRYALQCKSPAEDFIACATGGAAARAELGLADNYYDTSAGQRERMLKTTEKLDKTGDRISQGRAQLAETEARSFVLLLCIPHPHKMAACAVLMSATVRQIHVTRRDRQTEYASSSGNIISWHMFGV